jgi:Protein of unknown function (DUF3626)
VFPAAVAALESVTARSSSGPPVPIAARVALHFHPDFDLRGQPVLERILATGTYVSQFVTGTSNGGLTAVADGDRWRWEQRIFSGAYDVSQPSDRPVYGALLLESDAYGPAPRFGSAYFRLRRSVVSRSTYAYPDSVFEPTAFGVGEQMGLIEIWRQDTPTDPLDHYIEAHVHGGVRIPEDAEALVLDPSFQDSGLADAARAAGLIVEWHHGYSVHVDTLMRHSDYRGADVAAAAAQLSDGDILTPSLLGRERGGAETDPQVLKRIWHCLARYGRAETGPAEAR